jgi:hypothetical protein
MPESPPTLTMVALIDQLEAAGLGKDAEEGD